MDTLEMRKELSACIDDVDAKMMEKRDWSAEANKEYFKALKKRRRFLKDVHKLISFRTPQEVKNRCWPEGDAECPNCGKRIDKMAYCQHCGQALDWPNW